MDKYIYADSQILAKADSQDEYSFYVHDRLGSTRLVVDDEGSVRNSYSYTAFGEDLPGECQTSVPNAFKFTGQWWDMEAGQYYLRARMYDPTLMRMTGRDPVFGKNKEPLSLHKYLYCQNEPVNRRDPSGRIWDLYVQARDASASVGALNWAKESLLGGLSLFNGTVQGYMNMFFGPDGMTDAQKFAVGFASGVIEMQLGMRVNARVGLTAAAIFRQAGNNAMTYKNTGQMDSHWGYKAATDIGLSFGIGAFGDSADDVINAATLFVLGFEESTLNSEITWGLEWMESMVK